MFVNYVDVSGKDVFDKHNRLIGRPYDFLAKLGGAYPQLTAMILSKGVFKKSYAVVPWSQIKKIDKAIQLNVAEETLRFEPEYNKEGFISIRTGVLDQQVVDVFNRKVIRVNDLHLLKVEKELRIAHVDVGFRSLLRRLGWERFFNALIKVFHPRARYLTHEQFIAWKFVQPLEVLPRKGTLRLDVSQKDLSAIPPADFSEIIEDLDPPERIALFRSLDFEKQVDVLNELDVDMQRDLMEELDAQATIKLMEKMDLDEVADLLEDLSKKEVNRILAMMSPMRARKIFSLMKYESDSAGGLMHAEFLSLRPNMIVSEAIQKFRELDLDLEMVYYAYVLDPDNKLLGVVTFKQLLLADPRDKIEAIMVDRPITVHVDEPAREVAFLMNKYDFLGVPVIDEKRVMKGVITIDDILALTIDEAWGEKPGLL